MKSTLTLGVLSFGLLLASAAAQDGDSAAEILAGPPGEPIDAALADGRLETRSALLHGRVVLPGGAPAEAALVVSSAGGKAVTDPTGEFSLSVEVPLGVRELRVTAARSAAGSSLSARASVTVDAALGGSAIGTLELGAGGACDPAWLPTFGGEPGLDSWAIALAVFDDGSGAGPALYVGGEFTAAGGIPCAHLAKWDGAAWSEVGGGTNDTVRALIVYDDGLGGGPALYVGGDFSIAGNTGVNHIGKWNGTTWSSVGGGTDYSVNTFTLYDDGTGHGPSLYAGGHFLFAGSVPANRIAKWSGTSWSALGSGTSAWVDALAVYDDGSGSGPALYAGGQFLSAGGVTANYVARWDGASWSALGSGMNDNVEALCAFDDGTGAGPRLYVGGEFTTAGGVSVNRIGAWDGTSWSPVGGGMNGTVQELIVYDDGSGSGAALYAGGQFSTAGGVSASRVANWDGTSWSALGGGVSGNVHALAGYDDGSPAGPGLYVVGFFTTAEGHAANQIAKWDGASWAPFEGGLDSAVAHLTVHDDGSGGGPVLFACGTFASADDVAVNHIAKWDGASWSPLGTGLSSTGRHLAVHDDGSGGGPALYVGGTFSTAGGLPASRIARWDGTAWSALGSGMDGNVWTLCVFDDGSGGGAELYAGGFFTLAGGIGASRIAKWDGTSWSALGSGLNGGVYALAVYDDGSGGGPALYVAGEFTTAGGVPASRIAKWDGATWSALGSGLNDIGREFLVHDDGTGGGPALFVGGWFTTAGGLSASRIAKWDGAAWAPLGSGTDNTVVALCAYDDGSGSGPELYVGGEFLAAGGTAASRIAKWNGTSWSPLGSGTNEWVSALEVYDDGTGGGPALFVGGLFSVSPAGDSYIARWGGCAGSGLGSAYCFGDGSATACPCANPGDMERGCANSAGPGAVLEAQGSGSVSAGDLVLSGWGLVPSFAGLYFQGTLRVSAGNGAPFGDGLRCAGGGVIRLQVRFADGAGRSSTTGDLEGMGAVSPGDTRTYQLWYRDPPGPCGSGFNLTNGIELTWSP